MPRETVPCPNLNHRRSNVSVRHCLRQLRRSRERSGEADPLPAPSATTRAARRAPLSASTVANRWRRAPESRIDSVEGPPDQKRPGRASARLTRIRWPSSSAPSVPAIAWLASIELR
jgi:hypothetical protein